MAGPEIQLFSRPPSSTCSPGPRACLAFWGPTKARGIRLMVAEEAGTYRVSHRFGRNLLQGGACSNWKPFSPLLQTSFMIQGNSRSRCVFLVRNFGETIGQNEKMGNSHDSYLTCQKTQSTIQPILHLYSR